MRLILTFKPLHSFIKIPYNYQQALQGLIYRHLKDKQFATFLHEEGYMNEKRSFKLFTFSRLIGKYQLDRPKKLMIFKDKIQWEVSSILPEFIHDLGQTLLTTPMLQLYNQPIKVEELTYAKPHITASPSRICMLSPMTIHSTYETEQGKKVTQFFSPQDPVFSHLIEQNLKKKYEAYYDQKLEGSLHITPLHVTPKDKVITSFKRFYITGYTGIYKLEGSLKLLQWALQVGLGARNSQGFGMFSIE